jgi:hypothetical protein
LVVPGKWNLLQNVGLSADYSLTRRDACQALAGTTNANGLATLGGELLAIAGTTVSSISPATALSQVTAIPGQLGNIGVSKSTLPSTAGKQDSADVATGLGYTVYVWRQLDLFGGQPSIMASVYTEDTQTRIVGPVALFTSNTALFPRVVFSNDAFFVFLVEQSSATIRCATFVPSLNPIAFGTLTTLVTGYPGGVVDAADMFVASTTKVAIAYAWGDTVTSVRVSSITRAGLIPVLGTTLNVFTEAQLPNAQIQGISMCSSATMAFVFAISTAGAALSGTAGRSFDPSAFSLRSSATVVDATAQPIASRSNVTCLQFAAASAAVFSDQASQYVATASLVPIRMAAVVDAGVASPLTVAIVKTLTNSSTFSGTPGVDAHGPTGPWICGRPFLVSTPTLGTSNSLVLPVRTISNWPTSVPAYPTLNQQNSLFFLDGISGAVIGKALYGSASVATVSASGAAFGVPCSTPIVPGGFAFVAIERELLSFSSGIETSLSGIRRLTLSALTSTPPIKAQLGSTLLLAGGMLSMYDGRQMREQGFHLFPEGVLVANVAATGSFAPGTYQFVAVYEWFDATGARHQSAPSLPATVTTANLDSVVFRIPSLRLTQTLAATNIAIYGTQNAGTIFNRVTSLAAPLGNNTFTSQATPTLLGPATTWASNELLYTQPDQAGTTLPNDSPGPCSVIAVHQNRAFVDLTDSPGSFRYSQQLIPGVGLQFNESLGGTVPIDAGGIVGFVDLDEKVFIFTPRRIYAITGTGPTSSGGYSNYSDPIQIPADVGCVEARSILATPFGIIFKSAKGWYLLTRDLSVKYIGGGVAAYDENNVTSAVMMQDRQECRFTTTLVAQTSVGTQLVFHYPTNEWSVTSIASSTLGAGKTYIATDALVWSTTGRYVSASLADGVNTDVAQVAQDSVGVNTPAFIQCVGRTSFLALSKLEGFQRIRWLYLTMSNSFGGPGNSNLSIRVDFDDVYGAVDPPGVNNAYSLTTDLGLGASSVVLDLRHKLRQQKCKSVAFTFTFTPYDTGNPGPDGLQAMMLQVGMKRGTYKLQASQSVG